MFIYGGVWIRTSGLYLNNSNIFVQCKMISIMWQIISYLHGSSCVPIEALMLCGWISLLSVLLGCSVVYWSMETPHFDEFLREKLHDTFIYIWMHVFKAKSSHYCRGRNIVQLCNVVAQTSSAKVCHATLFFQGIGELFERIKQESKANGFPNGDGIFFTNLYVTPVLRNISLHLQKGEMLAVAGSTGSGKVQQQESHTATFLF